MIIDPQKQAEHFRRRQQVWQEAANDKRKYGAKLRRRFQVEADAARTNAERWERTIPQARKFLTRQEATYRLGLMDAAQRKEPAGVRVACRDRETGEVYEAQDDEVLHAQIAIRTGRSGLLQDGWTIPADHQEEA